MMCNQRCPRSSLDDVRGAVSESARNRTRHTVRLTVGRRTDRPTFLPAFSPSATPEACPSKKPLLLEPMAAVPRLKLAAIASSSTSTSVIEPSDRAQAVLGAEVGGEVDDPTKVSRSKPSIDRSVYMPAA